jgi:tetratricopeptide (TPR) repeat protein
MSRARGWWPLVIVLAAVSLLVGVGCVSRGTVPPSALELNRAGAEAFAKGDYDRATACFSAALEYQPRFVDAWVNLGMVELSRGELDAAERRFRHALAIDGDAAGAWLGLGAIAERRGDAKGAEAAYRRALSIDPGLPEPRANLARLLVARGALDEARDQLVRLVELRSDDPAGFVALAEVLWRLDRDQEASEVVDEATARFGLRSEIELLIARRDLKRGALGEAIARLEPITRAPGAIGRAALGWLGVARCLAGDVPGAIAAANAALGRDPDDPLAKHVLATCK